MKTFREWLNQKEYIDCDIHNKKKFEMYSNSIDIHQNLLSLNEAIILPENIKINTHNQEKLNKEFNKYNITFFNSLKNELWARYNPKNDETEVYYSDKNTFNEIEAILGHEMVHKAQNKLNTKFIEQAENLVKRINSRQEKMSELMNINTIESMKEWQKLLKINEKERLEFLLNSVFEKMAYAYSEVKMNRDGKLSDLIEKFRKNGFLVDNTLKKYIGMYWLIKDKL